MRSHTNGQHDPPRETIWNVTRTAWFHCFAGIAGDMALGSLIDAGADIGEVRSILERLPLGGWAIAAESVTRAGLGGTKVHVEVPGDSSVVRTYSHITALIEEARLPERARARAQATFGALAEAEAHVHRRPVQQIHFHEVGGIDAIIDIVGTCAALEILGVEEVRSSPLAQGMGMIRSEHGMLPNPSPAVAALLASRGVPTFGRDIPMELTTPTGAALVTALATVFGPIPAMSVSSVGYGAGSRDIDGLPNLVQVVIGDAAVIGGAAHPLVLMDANVDDVTGEVLGHVIGVLLEAGALDAWVTPIVMKKGRPAYTVSALSDPVLADQISDVLAMETGTLGVRRTAVDRWAAKRQMHEVELDGYPVRIKVGPGRAKAEFEDAARIARRTGMPLREVLAKAEAAWRRAQEARSEHPSGGDSA